MNLFNCVCLSEYSLSVHVSIHSSLNPRKATRRSEPQDRMHATILPSIYSTCRRIIHASHTCEPIKHQGKDARDTSCQLLSRQPLACLLRNVLKQKQQPRRVVEHEKYLALDNPDAVPSLSQPHKARDWLFACRWRSALEAVHCLQPFKGHLCKYRRHFRYYLIYYLRLWTVSSPPSHTCVGCGCVSHVNTNARVRACSFVCERVDA